MGYSRTLIAVADDCPATSGVVPLPRGPRRTVAALQYEMIAGSPHRYTQEDVLFTVWLLRRDLPDMPRAEAQALRADFFAKPQACLRSSPLPKKYGWGLLFDERGRVALCPMESEQYQELVAGNSVTVLLALRSSRA